MEHRGPDYGTTQQPAEQLQKWVPSFTTHCDRPSFYYENELRSVASRIAELNE